MLPPVNGCWLLCLAVRDVTANRLTSNLCLVGIGRVVDSRGVINVHAVLTNTKQILA